MLQHIPLGFKRDNRNGSTVWTLYPATPDTKFIHPWRPDPESSSPMEIPLMTPAGGGPSPLCTPPPARPWGVEFYQLMPLTSLIRGEALAGRKVRPYRSFCQLVSTSQFTHLLIPLSLLYHEEGLCLFPPKSAPPPAVLHTIIAIQPPPPSTPFSSVLCL